MRTRSIMLTIRVTPEEKDAIKSAATKANLPVEAFARLVLLRHPADQIVIKQVDSGWSDAAREMAKIGNNINQLAHQANTYKHADIVTLRSCQTLLEELWLFVNQSPAAKA